MTSLSLPSVVPFTSNIERGNNAAKYRFERAMRDELTHDLSAGNVVITTEQAQTAFLHSVSGVATSGRTLTFPAVTRPFLVHSPATSTDSISVVKGATSIAHAAGLLALYYSGSGTDDLHAVDIGGSNTAPIIGSQFSGALADMDTNQSITAATDTTLEYDGEIYDLDGWHVTGTDGETMTVPAGVERVIVKAGFRTTANVFGALQHFWVAVNGAAKWGSAANAVFAFPSLNGADVITSPPLAVSEGDTITVGYRIESGTPTISAAARATFFSVHGFRRVDQYQALPGGDIPVDFISGTPGTASVVYKKTITRAAEFPADFAGSFGHVGTNPSSTTTFDVKKNGSGIGTVAVSTSGVFTFATSGGTAQTVVSGDRITVETQGSVNGIADIGMTLKGRLT